MEEHKNSEKMQENVTVFKHSEEKASGTWKWNILFLSQVAPKQKLKHESAAP